MFCTETRKQKQNTEDDKYEAGVGYPQADMMLALMELYGVGVNEIVKVQELLHLVVGLKTSCYNKLWYFLTEDR